MKKLTFCLAFLSCTSYLSAQTLGDRIPENSLLSFYLRSIVLFVFCSMAGYFIVTIIQQFMNHQLRKKIIEHHIPETLAAELLSTGKKDRRKAAVKWTILTTMSALGILTAGLVQPYGFVSIAIILLSLAIGFFLYYLYVNRVGD